MDSECTVNNGKYSIHYSLAIEGTERKHLTDDVLLTPAHQASLSLNEVLHKYFTQSIKAFGSSSYQQGAPKLQAPECLTG